METYYPVLRRAALFDGIDPADYPAMLRCLDARVRTYRAGQNVFTSGDSSWRPGIVLKGAVDVLRGDVWGNRNIIARIESGGMFGEAYAIACAGEIPVDALCADDADVLLFDWRGMLAPAPCAFHARLTQNMLGILARKNITLGDKVDVLSKRRVRDKVLAFLWPFAQNADGGAFDIPFSREEMADFLGVDRSALSAELGRMRDAELIEFTKNRFRLLAR